MIRVRLCVLFILLLWVAVPTIAHSQADTQSKEALDALDKALNKAKTPSQPPAQSNSQSSPAKDSSAKPTDRPLKREKAKPTVEAPQPSYEVQESTLFDNINPGSVTGGSTSPTEFFLSSPARLTNIMTYHYFNQGRLPGTIGLRDQDGNIYGPWNATGLPGQGNVPNAFWEVKVDQALPAGTYVIIDSDPQTWSSNRQSQGKGFAAVRGRRGF